MQFSKQVNVLGRWTTVELNDKEIIDALDELRKINMTQLKLCLVESKELDVGTENRMKVALALFEKCGIASFSHLSSLAESKGRNKEPPKMTKTPEFQRAKEIAEKKLSEKTDLGKSASAIDKVFGCQE
jgi:hypothetical protein